MRQAAAVHLTSEIEASELRALGFRCARLGSCGQWHRVAGSEWSDDKSGATFSNGTRRPYVLFLGRLNWKKGLDRLIPAMEQVTNADLLIAGNDEENYRPELEALARRCGVVDRVRFLGPVDGEQEMGAALFGRNSGAAVVLGKFWQCRFGGHGRGLCGDCNA